MSTPLSGNKLANALLTKPQFDEFVAARMADPLQPAIERMPDSLQAVIDRDIARDCALW